MTFGLFTNPSKLIFLSPGFDLKRYHFLWTGPHRQTANTHLALHNGLAAPNKNIPEKKCFLKKTNQKTCQAFFRVDAFF